MDDNFFPMEFTIRPNVQETFEFPGRTTFRVIYYLGYWANCVRPRAGNGDI